MSVWTSKSAPGGWSYGYGEYAKTIAQIAQAEQKYQQVIGGLPGWVQGAAQILRLKGEEMLAQRVGTLDQYTKMPTYYLWIKEPDGTKYIGGEWTVVTGGAKAMQSYFAEVFEPAIQSTFLTVATASAITSASKAAVGNWNPATDPGRLAAETRKLDGGGGGGETPIASGGGSGGGGAVVPLLLAGGLVLVLALRR
jgi:hypothetical protein